MTVSYTHLDVYKRQTLKRKIVEKAAKYLDCDASLLEFDGDAVRERDGERSISMKEIGNRVMCSNEDALSACESHYSPVSPPPFMVGMAEVEVDKETGAVELIDYVAVVDCGTVVNPDVYKRQIRHCGCDSAVGGGYGFPHGPANY